MLRNSLSSKITAGIAAATFALAAGSGMALAQENDPIGDLPVNNSVDQGSADDDLGGDNVEEVPDSPAPTTPADPIVEAPVTEVPDNPAPSPEAPAPAPESPSVQAPAPQSPAPQGQAPQAPSPQGQAPQAPVSTGTGSGSYSGTTNTQGTTSGTYNNTPAKGSYVGSGKSDSKSLANTGASVIGLGIAAATALAGGAGVAMKARKN